MKHTKLIMGMPITIEILDEGVSPTLFKQAFDYFRSIDKQFSPFKRNSEVSRINRMSFWKATTFPESLTAVIERDAGLGQHDESEVEITEPMKEVLLLAEKTKQETNDYFDVWHNGAFDPSGIVKGWAIHNATKIIDAEGFQNYYIDAGGDIQANGTNKNKSSWRVGIRNPFNPKEIIKIVYIQNQGLATSGTYERGQHIYNPHSDKPLNDIFSISVIGPNILEADRFATGAFAMGRLGIEFIENLPGFEGYMIDRNGIATYTSNFKTYEIH